MFYVLYTTIDISHTGQFRYEPGKELLHKEEQNFQTVLQTLGMRANIAYDNPPKLMKTVGNLLGFNTDKIIKVWTFEFYTERDYLFELNNDPVGYLIEDFDAVPYIAGLDESVEQNYPVFVTAGDYRNIIFHKK
jgi:hypothetical protein